MKRTIFALLFVLMNPLCRIVATVSSTKELGIQDAKSRRARTMFAEMNLGVVEMVMIVVEDVGMVYAGMTY